MNQAEEDARDPQRDAFERVVEKWTGRSMAENHAGKMTGLELAWFIWQAAVAQERERCAKVCELNGASWVTVDGKFEDAAAAIRKGEYLTSC